MVDIYNPIVPAADKARELSRQLMIQSFGNPIVVVFRKRDGSIRVLKGRLGVTERLKDPIAGDPQAADTPDLITVFDDEKQAYRSVRIDRILSLKACGVSLEVGDEIVDRNGSSGHKGVSNGKDRPISGAERLSLWFWAFWIIVPTLLGILAMLKG